MKYFLFLSITIAVISCSNKQKENYKETVLPADTIQATTLNNDSATSQQPIISDVKYLSLTGDFDGDGTQETLNEHYFSNALNKEVPFSQAEDFDERIIETNSLEPISFMTCSNNKIDTLYLSNAPLFGIYYLKNEGDLDGDGGDEISYILDWTDFSTTNTCYIASYKKR